MIDVRERVLLLSLPRSATTHTCDLFDRYMKQMIGNEYIGIHSEILYYSNWIAYPWIEKQTIKLCEKYNVDVHEIKQNKKKFIEYFEMLLHRENSYIIKYFPVVMEEVISVDKMIELCIANNIKIVLQYRTSLLDQLLSLVAGRSIGKLNYRKNENIPEHYGILKIDENAVDMVGRSISMYTATVNKFKEKCNIVHELIYENLSFDSTDFADVVSSYDSSIVIDSELNKILSKEKNKKILDNNPHVKQRILRVILDNELDVDVTWKPFNK